MCLRPAPTPPTPRARALLAPSRLVALCPAPAQAAADATLGAPPSAAASRQVSEGGPALGHARGLAPPQPQTAAAARVSAGSASARALARRGPSVQTPRVPTPPRLPGTRPAPRLPPPLPGAPPAEVRSPFLRPTPAGSRGPRALTRAAASQPSSDKPSARGLRLFSCSRPASALVATAAPKKDPRPTEPPSARVGRADPCLPASQKRPHPDLLLTLSPGA